MRVEIGQEQVAVRLSWWQKLVGLMRDIHVPLRDVDAAEVIAKPLGVATRAGIKVGLRLPFVCYVARTIRLDEAFVVRRGVPGLSFAVENEGTLRRVVVSTPRARELAARLRER